MANLAVGFDNLDVAAATERGVVVTNTPGVLTDATADLAFTLLLAAARRVGEGERLVRGGDWRVWGPSQLLGRAVAGQSLGIVGMGAIGTAVARRARGFGMSVRYFNRHPNPTAEAETGARLVELDELLATSDFVSLHAPLNEQSRHLIDAAALARMKPTGVLVNTARGALVDERALVAALRAGTIAAAGLDVFEDEPALGARVWSSSTTWWCCHTSARPPPPPGQPWSSWPAPTSWPCCAAIGRPRRSTRRSCHDRHTAHTRAATATLARLGAATLGESGGRAMRARIRPMWSGAAVVGPAVPVRCAPGDNLAIHVAAAPRRRGQRAGGGDRGPTRARPLG